MLRKHYMLIFLSGSLLFSFLGYIKSRTSDQAIGLEYSSTCLSETEECKLKLVQERERAKKIFHSVRFTPSSTMDDA